MGVAEQRGATAPATGRNAMGDLHPGASRAVAARGEALVTDASRGAPARPQAARLLSAIESAGAPTH